jgi:hypothetical protein
MQGKIVSCKPAALQKKKENMKALCLDSEQNPIQNKDIVKVSLAYVISDHFPKISDLKLI